MELGLYLVHEGVFEVYPCGVGIDAFDVLARFGLACTLETCKCEDREHILEVRNNLHKLCVVFHALFMEPLAL